MRELMGQTCMAGFSPAFKQNMEAIGLPVPTGLFATQQQAAATIGQLLGLVKTFGMKVTVRELIGAGNLTDFLGVAAAYSAAYYAGGAIGSLIVAIDRTIGCKVGPVTQGQIHRAMLGGAFVVTEPMLVLLLRHPEIVSSSMPNRRVYGSMARAVATTKQ
jgi:hypothetical protein